MYNSVIICVDDETVVLESLKEQLKRHLDDCHEIELAESGEEALEIIEDLHAEGIDIPLVISDQIMPGMKGDELLIEIHSLYPKIMKIMLTGQASADAVGNALNGANLYHYIPKPWDETDLCLTAKEALRSYFQDKRLAQQNQELQQFAASLEQKVIERTAELTQANEQLQAEVVERRLLEEKLLVSEQKLRAVFEAMTDIVLIVDEQGQIEVAPTQPTRLYSPDDPLLDLTIERFFQEGERDNWFDKIQQAATNPEEMNFDYSLDLRDRVLWFSATLSRLPNRTVLWVARDISDRKQAETALQEAKEVAEAANQAKSTFLANMSHELRSPLNVILGFCQLMSRSTNLQEEHRDNIQIMNRSGQHLLALINNVLDLSKIEAGRITLEVTPFSLANLLKEVREMFNLKAENKGLKLVFAQATELPPSIQTDKVKLRQVLINLMSNAIKFTERGSIALNVSAVGDDPQEDRVQLRFEVADTGAGIAPEELNLLFEAFSQTTTGQEAKEGTGLGLAIAQKFVRLMGGEIAVTSTVGEGTTFSFTIPVRPASNAESEPSAALQRVIALAPDSPRDRLLVVDDRWDNRQLLVKLLESVGFEVQEASNGEKALEIWQSWHPQVIWMDIRMPIMDGYEATKRIRKAELKRKEAGEDVSPVTIIALTASVFDEQQEVLLSIGCDDFLHKPFTEKIIFEKLSQHRGTSYLYEESSSVTMEENAEDAELDSISDLLTTMPPQWTQDLYEAANAIDNEQIFQLIEQIPDDRDRLKHAIADLVNTFCCDRIVDLIEATGKIES
ncbi:response regulator [Lusitaniella coriacea LEGE 07157]|uniref:Circadian input-output histidine kinase CikA n=1 Tax=Lusitaniella coriacea LEGE 07157 TaxID=945747 RepID=A0A8J7IT72_9CYAN|nr:response regulator [Lusitaniella coriacea]MBE9115678.1 response regulator [Lusitaniella coriacea LEGE 07157]